MRDRSSAACSVGVGPRRETDVATIKDIVIDCELPSALARFWAEVLDGYEVRPYDDEEIARLASLGYTPETDPSVMVDGPGHTLCFQKVPEPKMTKNRVHLDLAAPDLGAEVERLVALGASVHQEQEGLTTLKDPEGNEFCVTDAH
jgi:hypothetical protein